MKYEQHAGQSQKKRLLAKAQNECLLGPNPAAVVAAQANQAAQQANQLKQEPGEFSTSSSSLNYDYPPYEHQKRASWVGPSSSSSNVNLVPPQPAHSHHHSNHHSSSSKRESSQYSGGNGASNNNGQSSSINMNPQQQQQPPIAHAKNIPSSSSTSSSWNGTPIYHHHMHHRQHQQQTNTTPLGGTNSINNSPIGSSQGTQMVAATLLQPQQAADIYAQTELYRRPTVFVSQAPYQTYNRVVPPPAHNGSSRQVIRNHPFIVPPLFCNKYR